METSVAMKSRYSPWRELAKACVLLAPFASALVVHAQFNIWTNSAGGNWEDPHWSLGALPGSGQSLFITNASSKTITISTATVQDFSQSLSVDSLTIQSPDTSSNVLLLSQAGFDVPLTARSISVGSNSAMTILASSLHINGPNGVGMSIGGSFTQDAGSLVAGNQVDVGYIGPGVYHLVDGLLTVTQVFLSGMASNVFVQDGGTNAAGIVHLEYGTYLLNDGEYDATTYFTGGTLVQQGGTLRIGTGGGANYWLCGGTNFAGVTGGTALQTGGMLHGHVAIDGGNYTLSNGVVDVGWMTLDGPSYFAQYGGTVTIGGTISTSGWSVGRGFDSEWYHGTYWLAGGTLSCGGINMLDGAYVQFGGTNIVAGSIIVERAGPASCPIHVYDGTLIASEIVAGPDGPYGGLIQNGGQIVVSNLTIGSGSPQNLPSQFLQTGGTIRQSGIFTLNNTSCLTVAPGDQEFGQLESSGGSSLAFASDAPTIIHFAGISSNMSLVISNWSGSFAGGGTQQIIFGNGSASTPPPGAILFRNPAGLPAGTYLARILSTGEVVPVPAPPEPWVAQWPGGMMWLSPQSNGSLRLDFQGIAGSNYLIQSSSNLIDWKPLTNVGPPDDVLSILNVRTTNGSSGYYRARLIE